MREMIRAEYPLDELTYARIGIGAAHQTLIRANPGGVHQHRRVRCFCRGRAAVGRDERQAGAVMRPLQTLIALDQVAQHLWSQVRPTSLSACAWRCREQLPLARRPASPRCPVFGRPGTASAVTWPRHAPPNRRRNIEITKHTKCPPALVPADRRLLRPAAAAVAATHAQRG